MSERYEVTNGESVDLDGVPYRFMGMSPDGPWGPSASLEAADGIIELSTPGCTRDGAHVYALEALLTNEPPRLIFSRRPASEEALAIQWGEPLDASPAETLLGGTQGS